MEAAGRRGAIALPSLREGRPAPPHVAQRRAVVAELRPHGLPDAIEVREETLAGVACVVCTPPDARGRLAHFHGGGYRMGRPAGWTRFGALLAEASRLEVILPDYRLAPEHPFPAALHDAVAVLAEVAQGAGPILLGGDSAGGGLAAATLLALGHEVTVAGMMLISPWLDLTNTAATFQSRADTDALFSLAAAREAAELYLQGAPAEAPLASPVNGDFSGAPPTLVLASGAEVLLQDSLSFVERLALQGVETHLHVFPGQAHDWAALQLDTPAGQRAMALMAGFVDGVLARA